MVDVTDLIPNPRNPNKHGDKQIAMLAKIIRHQGWRAPIVVSKRSGFVVTGHGRLEAAKLLQVQTVPVDFQDFKNEDDERSHLIADNRIAEMAEIDDNELAKLLEEVGKTELAGFDKEDFAALIASIEIKTEDDEHEVQPSGLSKTKTCPHCKKQI